ncbi:hypothetical protein LXL04_001317 [Taraxacum kok-saghyz]
MADQTKPQPQSIIQDTTSFNLALIPIVRNRDRGQRRLVPKELTFIPTRKPGDCRAVSMFENDCYSNLRIWLMEHYNEKICIIEEMTAISPVVRSKRLVSSGGLLNTVYDVLCKDIAHLFQRTDAANTKRMRAAVEGIEADILFMDQMEVEGFFKTDERPAEIPLVDYENGSTCNISSKVTRQGPCELPNTQTLNSNLKLFQNSFKSEAFDLLVSNNPASNSK